MMTTGSHATELAKYVYEATEKEITAQLNELVSRGLLVVETQGPFLSAEPYNHHVSVRLAVRLKLKDQEYIEGLEKEITELKAVIDGFKQATDALNL